jgi:hypothetical protein
MFDLKMRQSNRNVCLTLDNFSGHNIAYQPTNVKIEFFEPNLTPFVQPLDAGVIRCFKAHYRQGFCHRALELDDAGEQDIYKISLVEAMFMAKDAWDAISSETIKNCWGHTGIQRPPIMLRVPPLRPHTNSNESDPHTTAAWDTLEKFATTDMSLPQAERMLKDHLGDRYVDEKWRPAFDAVMAAENNAAAALEAIQELKHSSNPNTSAALLSLHASTTQCADLEENLMSSVKALKSRNRIFGPMPTIEELINPSKERENEDNLQNLNDNEIVAQVRYEKALEKGEIVEIESEEEDEDALPPVTTTKALEMCKILNSFCLGSGADSAMELSKVLRRFQAEVSLDSMQRMKQASLVDLWGSTS